MRIAAFMPSGNSSQGNVQNADILAGLSAFHPWAAAKALSDAWQEGAFTLVICASAPQSICSPPVILSTPKTIILQVRSRSPHDDQARGSRASLCRPRGLPPPVLLLLHVASD